MTVAPFLAYNASQHSGIFWRMAVLRAAGPGGRGRGAGDLVAAGGRYSTYQPTGFTKFTVNITTNKLPMRKSIAIQHEV